MCFDMVTSGTHHQINIIISVANNTLFRYTVDELLVAFISLSHTNNTSHEPERLLRLQPNNQQTKPTPIHITMPRSMAPPPSGEFTIRLQKPFNGKSQCQRTFPRITITNNLHKAPPPTPSKSSASPTAQPSCAPRSTRAASSRRRRAATSPRTTSTSS